MYVYYVIGLETKKILYAGTRMDCMKEVQRDYPSGSKHQFIDGKTKRRNILPEAMEIIRADLYYKREKNREEAEVVF